MIPTKSYTIWFSQRTGSTLLTQALASTGVAGNPAEWLTFQDPATMTRETLQSILRDGTTSNGVFGLKVNFEQRWIDAFRALLELPQDVSRAAVWSAAFPNCTKHIFMTRRNKVRLAVSWWRAIVSGEWHRAHGEKPQEQDIADQYNYDAINHLLTECVIREAAIEDFLSESGIAAMTVVYEDFILEYEATVRNVLEFMDIPNEGVTVAPPAYDRIADDVAEDWVQRFRRERQADWDAPRW
jgi:trehalose 2-sulfotransferase